MMLHDLSLDGGDADAVTWSGDIPDDVRAESHTVVIGCGESGLLAAIRLRQAGLPFTVIEKADGPGGTWRHNRYPGAASTLAAISTATPSSRPSTGASTSAASPSSSTTSPVSSTSTSSAALPLRHRGDGRGRGTTTSARWRVDVRGGRRRRRRDRRSLRDQCRRLAEPAAVARHPRDATRSRDGRSTRPAGRPTSMSPAALRARRRRRERLPDRTDDRGRRRAVHIFQRTAQWMFPNPLYRTTVPAGDRWAMRHLPFYGRWFRFLMT